MYLKSLNTIAHKCLPSLEGIEKKKRDNNTNERLLNSVVFRDRYAQAYILFKLNGVVIVND